MQRLIQWLLWAALLSTLAGTIANTTWAFATVNGGALALGALQAVAADLGLVALAATLAVRRAQGERSRWLWAAVAGFVAVSTYASYLHSYAQATPLDAPLAALRPLLLGAFLPLMLFALVEVVSHARKAALAATAEPAQPAQERAQDAHAPSATTAEPARKRRRVRRFVRRLPPQLPQPSAPVPAQEPPQARTRCHYCRKDFGSANALRAHEWRCAERTTAEAPQVVPHTNGNGAH